MIKQNTIVLAVVQHYKSGNKKYAVLKKVDEDDCDWRTEDDNSELAHEWNVIKSITLPKL